MALVSEIVVPQRPQSLEIVPPPVADSARRHHPADAPLEHLLKRRIGCVEQADQSPLQEARRPPLHVLNLDKAGGPLVGIRRHPLFEPEYGANQMQT